MKSSAVKVETPMSRAATSLETPDWIEDQPWSHRMVAMGGVGGREDGGRFYSSEW